MTERTDTVRARSATGIIVAGALVGAAVAVAAMEWLLINVMATDPLWDLAVYRGAIDQWLGGGGLYDFRLDHPAREGGFPFTYPPFAAIVMVPLVWIPTELADNLWTFGSLVLTVTMAAFVVWRAPRTPATWLGPSPRTTTLVSFTAAAVILLLLTFPGVHNLVLGQISFLIAALMLIDVGGGVPARFRGALVGIAGALKLTPLMAVPYFAVTRQWRAMLMAVGVFGAATVAALIIYPTGSIEYWTRSLLETSRVGDPATVQNKSILGLLSRWDGPVTGSTVLWVLLVVAVVGMALWHARRQYLHGDQVAAALIVGCAAVAASPVSWPHHQVWIILVAVWLLLRRRPLFMVLGAAIVLINLAGSPLMGQEVVPLAADDPLLLMLGRELPTLSFVIVCLAGLPLRSDATANTGHGSMAPAESTPSATGE